jgi:myo-inositol-1(or 4)-monophosphatase
MDSQATLAKAESIAREGGAILREYYQKPREFSLKGEVDLVTEADRAVEAHIVNALKIAFPQYSIVAEEGNEYSPGKGASDYYWYVDPVDGTTNFSHRLPHFSITLALAGIDRKPEIGVVYDPIRDECFTAYKGGGAYLNGTKIAVSTTSDLISALLCTGFPYDRRTSPENNLKEFNKMILRVQGVHRLGSAALDLAYVACGRLDGYWETKLNLWDCLAGVLLVQEAGGKVTDYRESENLLYQKRPQVLASNGLIHNEMSIVLVTAR